MSSTNVQWRTTQRRPYDHQHRGACRHDRRPGSPPQRPEPLPTTPSAAPGFRRKRTLDAPTERVARAVLRAKQGDRDALRFLYATYADNVFGYVCSIVRDEHEAEDVTQHVFMKLMTVIGRYERRTMPFSAWILRVAHNAAIDHLRTRRPVPCDEVRGADDAGDDIGLDRGRSLRVALDELPDDQRKVVVMRHVVGLSPGEIARELGKTEHAVHGLHHRGRRALRDALHRLDSAPTTLAA
jgi:RNA polymerase sigma-70 factor (ECF subfamily)